MRGFRGEIDKPEFLEILEAEDYLLLGAVLVLPWLFGGVEIWAFRLASLLLVASAAVGLARHGWDALKLENGKAVVLPAILLAAWAGLQIVPLPPALIAALSPTADAIYVEALPGYPQVEPGVVAALEAAALAAVPEADGIPSPPRDEGFFGERPVGNWTGWRTLSLLPQAGLERLLWYVALLLGFLVACRRLSDPGRAHIYRAALFGLFAALALFAWIQAATFNGKMYWIRPVRDPAIRPFGPFVNPTNFAAVMELAVPWIVGYGLLVLRRTGGGLLGLLRSPIFAVGALLCFSAGLGAASKFAAVLMALSLTLMLFIGVRRRSYRLGIAVGAVLAWGSLAFLIQGTRLGERLLAFAESAPSIDGLSRVVAAKSALPMLRDFLFVGSGFGSFREVFGRYQPAGEYLVWNQLHNDYLEVLIEGGLVAGALLLWLAAAFWWRVLPPAAWRRRRFVDLEHLGLITGLAAMSVHAVVDFNHQIPANALLFVVLGAFAATNRARLRQPGG